MNRGPWKPPPPHHADAYYITWSSGRRAACRRLPCGCRPATVPSPAVWPARRSRAASASSRVWRTTRATVRRTARNSTVGPRPGSSGKRRTCTCRPTPRSRSAGWARPAGRTARCRRICHGPCPPTRLRWARCGRAGTRWTGTPRAPRARAPWPAASRSRTSTWGPSVFATPSAKTNTCKRLWTRTTRGTSNADERVISY